MAEKFLKSMQASKVAPRNFSGVMTPKFGRLIMIWQFNRNRLIGAAVININNIDNCAEKLKAAKDSIDWFEVAKENNDTGSVSTDNVS